MNLWIDGIGLWSGRLDGYTALCERLAGGEAREAVPPVAAWLPTNERRRAPVGVKLAVEVAGQALAMSGREPAALASVFASAHGDQALTDAICTTLARAPTELSPTRFHHAVHNAAAGYWTMATGCRAPSSAVCAGVHTFGAALLEAAAQAQAEQRAVLLVASDTAGSGPLLAMTGCTQAFGCALLLAPARGPQALASLQLQLADAGPHTPPPAALAGEAHGNPIAAPALPLLALLAGAGGRCRLGAADALDLQLTVTRAA